jgi:hypothetical protein
MRLLWHRVMELTSYTAWKALSDAGSKIRFFERIADVDVYADVVVNVDDADPLIVLSFVFGR